MPTNSMTPLFIRAMRNQSVERPPVWLMRQAGRYLSEYRELKEKYSFLELCKSPELALEITLQPMRIIDPDAAIVFADILLPLEGMGIDIDFNPGPQIQNPVRNADDVEALRVANVQRDLGYVFETISLLKKTFSEHSDWSKTKAAVGFSGAPWTMACYMTASGRTKNFSDAQIVARQNPRAMKLLLEKIVQTTSNYLAAQIESGADAVQIFDTWAGNLSIDDYRKWALPCTIEVIEKIKAYGCPIILYVGDSSHLFPAMLESGADCLSIDWRMDLKKCEQLAKGRVVIQGNLDPTHLFGSIEEVRNAARIMVGHWSARQGYVANLGHGVLQNTPRENVIAFVNAVKEGW